MEKSGVKFTVAICAYNIEDYIGRAIDSVVNQEFKNYELIIVDDCSTDKTIEVAQKYRQRNISIYKTKQNSGTAGAARNIAIKEAKGEYILFLDGDDALYNEKTLKDIDKIIDNNTYDIIYLGYESIGKTGTSLRLSNAKNSTKKARLICDESFSVSSKCWNMKFIRDNHLTFKEGMYYEDELYSIKGNVLAQNTTYGEFPIFKYFRNREGSVMTKPTIKKCSDWYRMLAEVMEIYEITPDEYKKYLLSFIKNETLSIPLRVKTVLEALMEHQNTKVLPKREYGFEDFFEDE